MNIIQALSSEKPYKREHWDCYYYPHVYKQFEIKDILAEDWVIDEDDMMSSHQLPIFPKTIEATYGF